MVAVIYVSDKISMLCNGFVKDEKSDMMDWLAGSNNHLIGANAFVFDNDDIYFSVAYISSSGFVHSVKIASREFSFAKNQNLAKQFVKAFNPRVAKIY